MELDRTFELILPDAYSRPKNASIMPNIPRANTNLTCIMIGEHIADLIRQSGARGRSLGRGSKRDRRAGAGAGRWPAAGGAVVERHGAATKAAQEGLKLI